MTPDEAYSDEDAELLAQMRADFLDESQDLFDALSLNLSKLEDDSQNSDIINEIFRGAHTIKGSASFVGLDEMRELAHKMEDVFGLIRDGKLAVTAEIIDVMYRSLNVLIELRDKASAGDTGKYDITGIVNELASSSKSVQQEQRQESRNPEEIKKSHASAVPKQTIVIEDSIKVRTEKLDDMLNLISELITAKNRLNGIADSLINENLQTVASQINRTTDDIYAGLMGIRMVELDRLFNKFHGVVRNLARDEGREVRLVIEGAETEIDKTVIEQLYDPLVHILRNAVGHGIEDPEQRRILGKPEQGTIKIEASQQHNSIYIFISDDGNGLDANMLRQAAIDKNIMPAAAAAALTDEQAYQLIFKAGFSTEKEVSDLAGRGVGMDVVVDHILRLRGQVKVKTEANKGTTFIIRLPLTLAIVEVLLVLADLNRYAVPVDTIIDTLTVKSGDIKKMEKNDIIFFRGEPIALQSLTGLLSDDDLSQPERINKMLGLGGSLTAMVLDLASVKTAVVVDYLFGKQEVVVKPLGPYIGAVKGVEGGSILPDGSVALVLDMMDILS